MIDPSVVELIPKKVLFGNPEKANPQVSPDGTMLSFLAPLGNVMNVWVQPRDGGQPRPVTRDTDRGIQSYGWVPDNLKILYIQDVGGDENFRLFSVDLATGEVRDLTPFPGVTVRIVASDRHRPNELLVAINRDNPTLHDVYHLDLTSCELTLIAKNPGSVIQWTADHDLNIRGAVSVRPDGGWDLLLRGSDDEPWRTAISWSDEDLIGSGPVGFSKDGQYLHLLDSRGANTARLVRLEIATGAIEVIAEDPEYDAGLVEVHPDEQTIQMVAFNRARLEWVVLDDSIREDIETIRTLHHGDFDIVSRDSADSIWVVMFSVDDGPTAYYVYDRSSRNATFLFVNRPELPQYRHSSMEPISFTSRDGLTIHGYITFPVGVERKNLPMVLNVHGGPWVRDTWRYHPEAQWLANRGYICLQVNYRGSTGYGKQFLNAGDKEWGGKMHDDLVDAVRWAEEQGYADPKRVAIYGGSYGGYASLVGATFTPDLFCCAVAIVGPSNLLTFIQTIPPYWTPLISQFVQRVGDPETEAEFLRSRSPLFKVDQITIPMLIAQGANDPRVKQSESEQIVEAMRHKGIDHEYLLFPDEGHGFTKPENRLRFYGAAERFLARHLGGRVESDPGGVDELADYEADLGRG